MSTGFLVVDVQPAYDAWCGEIAKKVAQRINNTCRPTVVMWVGEGITPDTEADVREYLRHHGARPGKLSDCAFIEKDYGFFRGWMDYGIDFDVIRKAGTEMLRSGLHTSSDLDLEQLLGDDAEKLPSYDSLHTPCFDTRPLSWLDKFETCGGGANECLAEVELLLDILAKPHKRIDNLVYGN